MADSAGKSPPDSPSPLCVSVPAAALLLSRNAAHLYRLCKAHRIGHKDANGHHVLTPRDFVTLASLKPGNPAWRANGRAAAADGSATRQSSAEQRFALNAH